MPTEAEPKFVRAARLHRVPAPMRATARTKKDSGRSRSSTGTTGASWRGAARDPSQAKPSSRIMTRSRAGSSIHERAARRLLVRRHPILGGRACQRELRRHRPPRREGCAGSFCRIFTEPDSGMDVKRTERRRPTAGALFGDLLRRGEGQLVRPTYLKGRERQTAITTCRGRRREVLSESQMRAIRTSGLTTTSMKLGTF